MTSNLRLSGNSLTLIPHQPAPKFFAGHSLKLYIISLSTDEPNAPPFYHKGSGDSKALA
jgi:hypothetical protein